MDDVTRIMGTPQPPGGVPVSLDDYDNKYDSGSHTQVSKASVPVRTLPQCADDIERKLGKALKAYRESAEDILDNHFEAMEKAQQAHDHEMSMLRIENAKLRELVGKSEDPAYPQNVLFQSMAPEPELTGKQKAKKGQMAKGSDDDDDRPATDKKGRKGKNKDNVAEQPGGTWQQFMAWVPNGAALMNAEPWKPLPEQGAGNKARGGPGNQSAQVWGVVPSALQDAKKKNKDDDDNSDSEEDEDSMKLELHEVWMPSQKEKKLRQNVGGGGDLESRCDSEAEEFVEETPHSRWILNPDSNIRIVWDMSSLFMVVYDMIMIPMAVFSMPDTPFLIMMDWTTRVFWTLDMGWSCCTGVVLANGSVEYNFRFILKRYFKSWFGLDFFIVGSDWSGVILSSGGMGLSKLARVSRIARVVRLLRLVRMQEVIANITERIQSDSMILGLQVFKIIAILIACCHATACGWWGVGNSSDNATWIKTYGYENKDVGLQYLVSLHWSFSQFSGGLEEFGPQSAVERFYTVLIWLVSFISGLVMLSFLTSSLTQQYIVGGSGARQMATLKKYLNQNKIPKNLIKRLCRSAKHAISGDLQPDSVDLLHIISEPLKIEMHYKMYSRLLGAHPFFQDFMSEGQQVMRRVCHSCMSTLLLDCGDVLFRQDDEPADGRMYFVFSGIFDYRDKYGEVHTVVEKQWVAEAALWTTWKHQGTLTASTDAKMAIIEADAFRDICQSYMKKSKGQGFNPKVYAAAYMLELNAQDEWTDLADSN